MKLEVTSDIMLKVKWKVWLISARSGETYDGNEETVVEINCDKYVTLNVPNITEKRKYLGFQLQYFDSFADEWKD